MKTPTSPESVLNVVFVAVFVTTISHWEWLRRVLSLTAPVSVPAATEQTGLILQAGNTKARTRRPLKPS